MTRSAALVLAMLAALCGAPPSVLAAPPNRLEAPAATPTSGTVLTTFALSVRYVSSGGNPASRVVADAGPLSVDLALLSGSHLDGLWAGEVQLPLGTWPVAFRAVVERGPQPTVAGPTLTVTAPASAAPSPGATIEPPPSGASAGPSPGRVPGGDEEPPDEESGPATSAGPTAVTDPHPGQGPGHTGSGNRRGEAPAATDSARPTDRRGTERWPSGRLVPGASGTGTGLLDDGAEEPSAEDLLLLLGIVVGVAAVALLGTGWMLASRSRNEEAEAAPAGRAATEARRARRRTRTPSHDPVLAAMGLDDDDAPTAGPAG